MAIEANDELAGFLKFLSGEDFPSANEDRLFRIAEAHATAAENIDASVALFIDGVQAYRQGMDGGTESAFVRDMEQLVLNDPGYLGIASKYVYRMGEAYQDTATTVQYVKLMIIAALVQLFLEFLIAIAMAWFNPAAALARIALIETIFKFLYKTLLRRIIWAVVTSQIIGIALQVAMDLFVQLYQIKGAHTRKEIDLELTKVAAEIGSLGAAIGMGLGGVFNLLDRLFKNLGLDKFLPKPDTGPKPDTKPDVVPSPKPDVVPDPKPDVVPSPKPDPAPNPQPAPVPSPGPKPNPKPSPDPKPSPNPSPGPNPSPNPSRSTAAPEPPPWARDTRGPISKYVGNEVTTEALTEYLTEGMYNLMTGNGWKVGWGAAVSGAVSGAVGMAGTSIGTGLRGDGDATVVTKETQTPQVIDDEQLPAYQSEYPDYAPPAYTETDETGVDPGTGPQSRPADTPTGRGDGETDTVTGRAVTPDTGTPHTSTPSPDAGGQTSGDQQQSTSDRSGQRADGVTSHDSRSAVTPPAGSAADSNTTGNPTNSGGGTSVSAPTSTGATTGGNDTVSSFGAAPDNGGTPHTGTITGVSNAPNIGSATGAGNTPSSSGTTGSSNTPNSGNTSGSSNTPGGSNTAGNNNAASNNAAGGSNTANSGGRTGTTAAPQPVTTSTGSSTTSSSTGSSTTPSSASTNGTTPGTAATPARVPSWTSQGPQTIQPATPAQSTPDVAEVPASSTPTKARSAPEQRTPDRDTTSAEEAPTRTPEEIVGIVPPHAPSTWTQTQLRTELQNRWNAAAGVGGPAGPAGDRTVGVLGPDYLGMRAVPPRPAEFAAIDFDTMETAQRASFFEAADLVRGPLTGPIRLTGRPDTVIETTNGATMQRRNPGRIRTAKTVKIPRLAHSIWLGGSLNPTSASKVTFRTNLEHTAATSGFGVVLWTDVTRAQVLAAQQAVPNTPEHTETADVREFVAWAAQHRIRLINVDEVFAAETPMRLQAPFQAERHRGLPLGYGAASDILRVEALYRFGGVYTDGDNRLTTNRPADTFTAAVRTVANSNVGLAVGTEPPSGNPGAVPRASNAVLVSPAGHQGVAALLDVISENYAHSHLENMSYSIGGNRTIMPPGVAPYTRASAREDVIYRSGPTASVFIGLAQRLGLAHRRDLPQVPVTLFDVTYGNSWLPGTNPIAPRPYTHAETLDLVLNVTSGLIYRAHAEAGTLNLAAVRELVESHQNPAMIWNTVLGFIAAQPELRAQVRAVTTQMTGVGAPVIGPMQLPQTALALLVPDLANTATAPPGVTWVRLTAPQPPVPPPVVQASVTVPPPAPAPAPTGVVVDRVRTPVVSDGPDWTAARAETPPVVRRHRWLDPVSRPGRGGTGRYLVEAHFDARPVETAGGTVMDLTVRVWYGDAPATTADTVHASARDGVRRYLNEPGYRLPGNGELLHVTLERATSPEDAHLVVDLVGGGTRMHQHAWHADADPVIYAHEIGHRLGLRDENRDSTAPHRPHVAGSLMGDPHSEPDPSGLAPDEADQVRLLTQGGLRDRHLHLIDRVIGDLTVADPEFRTTPAVPPRAPGDPTVQQLGDMLRRRWRPGNGVGGNAGVGGARTARSLGPDYLGVRGAPPRPAHIGGVNTTGMAAARRASFFAQAHLGHGRLTAQPRPREDATTVIESAAGQTQPSRRFGTWLPKPVRIPRLSHSIWLGGPLGNTGAALEFRQNLEQTRQNSRFDVVLWTDVTREQIVAARQSLPGTDDVRNFVEWADQQQIRLINVGEIFHAEAPMHLQAQYTAEWSRGVKSAYGAASDILRAEVLHRFGGVYTDGDNTLNGDLDAAVQQVVDSDSGLAIGAESTTVPGAVGRNSNAVLVTPASHPSIRAYLDAISQNYTRGMEENQFFAAAGTETTAPDTVTAYTRETMKQDVVFRTGPSRSLFRQLATALGVGTTSGLPRVPADLYTVTFSNTWLADTPPVSRPHTAEQTRQLVTQVTSALLFRLHAEGGTLNLAQVRDQVDVHHDPALIWTSVLTFLAAQPEVRARVQAITTTMTGPNAPVRPPLTLPPAVEALIQDTVPAPRAIAGVRWATLRDPATVAPTAVPPPAPLSGPPPEQLIMPPHAPESAPPPVPSSPDGASPDAPAPVVPPSAPAVQLPKTEAPLVSAPADGACLLYSTLVSDPALVLATLRSQLPGHRLLHDPAMVEWLSDPARVRADVGYAAANLSTHAWPVPAASPAARAANALADLVAHRLRDDAGLPAEVVAARHMLAETFGHDGRDTPRDELLAEVRRLGEDRVTDASLLDADTLRQKYADVRLRELRTRNPWASELDVQLEAAFGLTLQEQLDHLAAYSEPIALDTLADDRLAAELTTRRAAAGEPLTASELDSLEGAVRAWPASWDTAVGESFPALVAHTLGVRMQLFDRESRDRSAMFGVEDAPPLVLFHNGADHFDGSAEPGTALPRAAAADLDADYGPPADPPPVADDTDLVLNPLWYPLESFPAAALRPGRRQDWRYVVTEGGQIFVGAAEVGAALRDRDWQRLLTGMQRADPDLTMTELREQLAGDSLIAADFDATGGLRTRPGRTAGDLRWNGRQNRWEVSGGSRDTATRVSQRFTAQLGTSVAVAEIADGRTRVDFAEGSSNLDQAGRRRVEELVEVAVREAERNWSAAVPRPIVIRVEGGANAFFSLRAGQARADRIRQVAEETLSRQLAARGIPRAMVTVRASSRGDGPSLAPHLPRRGPARGADRRQAALWIQQGPPVAADSTLAAVREALRGDGTLTTLTRDPDGGWLAGGRRLDIAPAPGRTDGLMLLTAAERTLLDAHALRSASVPVIVHAAGRHVLVPVTAPDGSRMQARLTPEQLAEIIADRTPGDATIALLSCATASVESGFARRLAAATGRDVISPQGDLVAGAPGSPAPITVDGRPWLLFTPDADDGWDLLNDIEAFDGYEARAPRPGETRGGVRLGRHVDAARAVLAAAGAHPEVDGEVETLIDDLRTPSANRSRTDHLARLAATYRTHRDVQAIRRYAEVLHRMTAFETDLAREFGESLLPSIADDLRGAFADARVATEIIALDTHLTMRRADADSAIRDLAVRGGTPEAMEAAAVEAGLLPDPADAHAWDGAAESLRLFLTAGLVTEALPADVPAELQPTLSDVLLPPLPVLPSEFDPDEARSITDTESGSDSDSDVDFDEGPPPPALRGDPAIVYPPAGSRLPSVEIAIETRAALHRLDRVFAPRARRAAQAATEARRALDDRARIVTADDALALGQRRDTAAEELTARTAVLDDAQRAHTVTAETLAAAETALAEADEAVAVLVDVSALDADLESAVTRLRQIAEEREAVEKRQVEVRDGLLADGLDADGRTALIAERNGLLRRHALLGAERITLERKETVLRTVRIQRGRDLDAAVAYAEHLRADWDMLHTETTGLQALLDQARAGRDDAHQTFADLDRQVRALDRALAEVRAESERADRHARDEAARAREARRALAEWRAYAGRTPDLTVFGPRTGEAGQHSHLGYSHERFLSEETAADVRALVERAAAPHTRWTERPDIQADIARLTTAEALRGDLPSETGTHGSTHIAGTGPDALRITLHATLTRVEERDLLPATPPHAVSQGENRKFQDVAVRHGTSGANYRNLPVPVQHFAGLGAENAARVMNISVVPRVTHNQQQRAVTTEVGSAHGMLEKLREPGYGHLYTVEWSVTVTPLTGTGGTPSPETVTGPVTVFFPEHIAIPDPPDDPETLPTPQQLRDYPMALDALHDPGETGPRVLRELAGLTRATLGEQAQRTVLDFASHGNLHANLPMLRTDGLLSDPISDADGNPIGVLRLRMTVVPDAHSRVVTRSKNNSLEFIDESAIAEGGTFRLQNAGDLPLTGGVTMTTATPEQTLKSGTFWGGNLSATLGRGGGVAHGADTVADSYIGRGFRSGEDHHTGGPRAATVADVGVRWTLELLTASGADPTPATWDGAADGHGARVRWLDYELAGPDPGLHPPAGIVDGDGPGMAVFRNFDAGTADGALTTYLREHGYLPRAGTGDDLQLRNLHRLRLVTSGTFRSVTLGQLRGEGNWVTFDKTTPAGVQRIAVRFVIPGPATATHRGSTSGIGMLMSADSFFRMGAVRSVFRSMRASLDGALNIPLRSWWPSSPLSNLTISGTPHGRTLQDTITAANTQVVAHQTLVDTEEAIHRFDLDMTMDIEVYGESDTVPGWAHRDEAVSVEAWVPDMRVTDTAPAPRAPLTSRPVTDGDLQLLTHAPTIPRLGGITSVRGSAALNTMLGGLAHDQFATWASRALPSLIGGRWPTLIGANPGLPASASAQARRALASEERQLGEIATALSSAVVSENVFQPGMASDAEGRFEVQAYISGTPVYVPPRTTEAHTAYVEDGHSRIGASTFTRTDEDATDRAIAPSLAHPLATPALTVRRTVRERDIDTSVLSGRDYRVNNYSAEVHTIRIPITMIGAFTGSARNVVSSIAALPSNTDLGRQWNLAPENESRAALDVPDGIEVVVSVMDLAAIQDALETTWPRTTDLTAITAADGQPHPWATPGEFIRGLPADLAAQVAEARTLLPPPPGATPLATAAPVYPPRRIAERRGLGTASVIDVTAPPRRGLYLSALDSLERAVPGITRPGHNSYGPQVLAWLAKRTSVNGLSSVIARYFSSGTTGAHAVIDRYTIPTTHNGGAVMVTVSVLARQIQDQNQNDIFGYGQTGAGLETHGMDVGTRTRGVQRARDWTARLGGPITAPADSTGRVRTAGAVGTLDGQSQRTRGVARSARTETRSVAKSSGDLARAAYPLELAVDVDVVPLKDWILAWIVPAAFAGLKTQWDAMLDRPRPERQWLPGRAVIEFETSEGTPHPLAADGPGQVTPAAILTGDGPHDVHGIAVGTPPPGTFTLDQMRALHPSGGLRPGLRVNWFSGTTLLPDAAGRVLPGFDPVELADFLGGETGGGNTHALLTEGGVTHTFLNTSLGPQFPGTLSVRTIAASPWRTAEDLHTGPDAAPFTIGENTPSVLEEFHVTGATTSTFTRQERRLTLGFAPLVSINSAPRQTPTEGDDPLHGVAPHEQHYTNLTILGVSFIGSSAREAGSSQRWVDLRAKRIAPAKKGDGTAETHPVVTRSRDVLLEVTGESPSLADMVRRAGISVRGAIGETARWVGDRRLPLVDGVARTVSGWADADGTATDLPVQRRTVLVAATVEARIPRDDATPSEPVPAGLHLRGADDPAVPAERDPIEGWTIVSGRGQDAAGVPLAGGRTAAEVLTALDQAGVARDTGVVLAGASPAMARALSRLRTGPVLVTEAPIGAEQLTGDRLAATLGAEATWTAYRDGEPEQTRTANLTDAIAALTPEADEHAVMALTAEGDEQALTPEGGDRAAGVPDRTGWTPVGEPEPVDMLLREHPRLTSINDGGDDPANCVLAAIAVEMQIRDRDRETYTAPPSVATEVGVLASWADRPLVEVAGLDTVADALTEIGARGVVVVNGRRGEVAHAFNAIRVAPGPHGVAFFDGQSGERATAPAAPARVRFLPTTDGVDLTRLERTPAPADPQSGEDVAGMKRRASQTDTDEANRKQARGSAPVAASLRDHTTLWQQAHASVVADLNAGAAGRASDTHVKTVMTAAMLFKSHNASFMPLDLEASNPRQINPYDLRNPDLYYRSQDKSSTLGIAKKVGTAGRPDTVIDEVFGDALRSRGNAQVPSATGSGAGPLRGSAGLRPTNSALVGNLITTDGFRNHGNPLGVGGAPGPGTVTAQNMRDALDGLGALLRDTGIGRNIAPDHTFVDHRMQRSRNIATSLADRLSDGLTNITVAHNGRNPNLTIELTALRSVDVIGTGLDKTRVVEWLQVYLAGLTTQMAAAAGLPLPLQIRQSFGFIDSTVADTGPSIRFSPGGEPPEFMLVVEAAIRRLDRDLPTLTADLENKQKRTLRNNGTWNLAAGDKKYLGWAAAVVAANGPNPLSTFVSWISTTKGDKFLGERQDQNVLRDPRTRKLDEARTQALRTMRDSAAAPAEQGDVIASLRLAVAQAAAEDTRLPVQDDLDNAIVFTGLLLEQYADLPGGPPVFGATARFAVDLVNAATTRAAVALDESGAQTPHDRALRHLELRNAAEDLIDAGTLLAAVLDAYPARRPDEESTAAVRRLTGNNRATVHYTSSGMQAIHAAVLTSTAPATDLLVDADAYFEAAEKSKGIIERKGEMTYTRVRVSDTAPLATTISALPAGTQPGAGTTPVPATGVHDMRVIDTTTYGDPLGLEALRDSDALRAAGTGQRIAVVASLLKYYQLGADQAAQGVIVDLDPVKDATPPVPAMVPNVRQFLSMLNDLRAADSIRFDESIQPYLPAISEFVFGDAAVPGDSAFPADQASAENEATRTDVIALLSLLDGLGVAEETIRAVLTHAGPGQVTFSHAAYQSALHDRLDALLHAMGRPALPRPSTAQPAVTVEAATIDDLIARSLVYGEDSDTEMEDAAAGVADRPGWQPIGSPDAVARLVAENPRLPQVNAPRDEGGEYLTNCVFASIATAHTLLEPDGVRYLALPSAATDVSLLADWAGTPLRELPGDGLVPALDAALTTVGAHGVLVLNGRAGGPAHAITVARVAPGPDGLAFYDGQSGRQATAPAGPARIRFLPVTAGIDLAALGDVAAGEARDTAGMYQNTAGPRGLQRTASAAFSDDGDPRDTQRLRQGSPATTSDMDVDQDPAADPWPESATEEEMAETYRLEEHGALSRTAIAAAAADLRSIPPVTGGRLDERVKTVLVAAMAFKAHNASFIPLDVQSAERRQVQALEYPVADKYWRSQAHHPIAKTASAATPLSDPDKKMDQAFLAEMKRRGDAGQLKEPGTQRGTGARPNNLRVLAEVNRKQFLAFAEKVGDQEPVPAPDPGTLDIVARGQALTEALAHLVAVTTPALTSGGASTDGMSYIDRRVAYSRAVATELNRRFAEGPDLTSVRVRDNGPNPNVSVYLHTLDRYTEARDTRIAERQAEIKADKLDNAVRIKKKDWADLDRMSEWLQVYLAGLTTSMAAAAGVPLPLQIRQSFGFVDSTVADTGSSIRFSPGSEPPEFVAIFEAAVRRLDTELPALLDRLTPIADVPNGPDDFNAYGAWHSDSGDKKYAGWAKAVTLTAGPGDGNTLMQFLTWVTGNKTEDLFGRTDRMSQLAGLLDDAATALGDAPVTYADEAARQTLWDAAAAAGTAGLPVVDHLDDAAMVAGNLLRTAVESGAAAFTVRANEFPRTVAFALDQLETVVEDATAAAYELVNGPTGTWERAEAHVRLRNAAEDLIDLTILLGAAAYVDPGRQPADFATRLVRNVLGPQSRAEVRFHDSGMQAINAAMLAAPARKPFVEADPDVYFEVPMYTAKIFQGDGTTVRISDAAPLDIAPPATGPARDVLAQAVEEEVWVVDLTAAGDVFNPGLLRRVAALGRPNRRVLIAASLVKYYQLGADYLAQGVVIDLNPPEQPQPFAVAGSATVPNVRQFLSMLDDLRVSGDMRIPTVLHRYAAAMIRLLDAAPDSPEQGLAEVRQFLRSLGVDEKEIQQLGAETGGETYRDRLRALLDRLNNPR
ncbi:hypothetical protein ACIA8K_25755 [Catenuloplanes sp. NPDC051500]|uniref:WXG100-like domain-containing protein n=1 Tax=Catenuloplanes sp. NPDC051500 TaxID=3363959 RepID=UPI00378D04C0